MTPLGLLNFMVLQWFGVRLARVVQVSTENREAGLRVNTLHVGWRVLRWIVPLTGWWSDYRWIARKP